MIKNKNQSNNSHSLDSKQQINFLFPNATYYAQSFPCYGLFFYSFGTP